MFISNDEKLKIHSKMFELEQDYFNLRNRTEILESTINALLKVYTEKEKAPHGVKKDGTPKAKPGRKQSFTVTVK